MITAWSGTRRARGTWEDDAIYAPYVARAPSGEYVMLYCGVAVSADVKMKARMACDGGLE